MRYPLNALGLDFPGAQPAPHLGVSVGGIRRIVEPAEGLDLGRVVLVAPLVRSVFWGVSTSLTPVVDAFVDYIPRVFQDNSSDEQFLEFVRQDPLQPRETSLAWFNALVAWNERIQNYPPNPRPILIIQGNADTIVDWEYNLEFLLSKFPNARVQMIDDGRHQLLNEGPELKVKVRQILDEVLAVQLKP